MRRPITIPILLAAAVVTFPAALFAQSRDNPPSTAGGPNAPTVPGAADPGGRGDTKPGVGTAGLPDAVTVLDILRRLPHFPGGRRDTNDDGPDEIKPPPPRNGPWPSADVTPPRRIAAVPPDRPFTPRPSPRPSGTPPIGTGVIVPETREREVIVTLNAGSDANTVYELSQDLGLEGETLYTSTLLNARVARFRIPDTRSVADVLSQLATDVRVTEAQPNYVFLASGAAQAQTLPVPQYAPEKLNLAAAHKIAQGKRVIVAVIDTAVDDTHPALAGAISGKFDAIGDTAVVADLHGTAIAGIVGARADLMGVAPASSLLGIRAFETTDNGSPQSHTMALLKSLDFAVASGARVVNMSFAGPNDPLLGRAIKAAVGKGVVAIAAAGNGGPNAKPFYPAAYPEVIAVTATDNNDATFKGANHGDYIAVAAPGVDIVAAAPGGAYDVSTGTSMAAAHVAGIAALMLEKKPNMTPADVRAALTGSARKEPGRAPDELGSGIADAAKALSAVK